MDDNDNNHVDDWEFIRSANRDLRKMAGQLGQEQVRAMVDWYYQVQHIRTAAKNQLRAAKGTDPAELIGWSYRAFHQIENNIRLTLGEFAHAYKVGRWVQSICGIGPVLSAGFLAHLDIRNRPTAGHFWNFAGMNTHLVWEKKTKRPYNARLKVLTYKVGKSFIFFKNHKKQFYGDHYNRRKEYEEQKNMDGKNVEFASNLLAEKNWKKDTKAKSYLVQGLLPPGHIDARARHWVGKLFLSHLHHAMYLDYYHDDPPVPFAFTKSGGSHGHWIEPPNWPIKEEGKSLAELYAIPSPEKPKRGDDD